MNVEALIARAQRQAAEDWYVRAAGTFAGIPETKAAREFLSMGALRAAVAEAYPLPRRQRELPFFLNGERVWFRYVVKHHRLEHRTDCGRWVDDTYPRYEHSAMTNPGLLKLWADLIENPTEEE